MMNGDPMNQLASQFDNMMISPPMASQNNGNQQQNPSVFVNPMSPADMHQNPNFFQQPNQFQMQPNMN